MIYLIGRRNSFPTHLCEGRLNFNFKKDLMGYYGNDYTVSVTSAFSERKVRVVDTVPPAPWEEWVTNVLERLGSLWLISKFLLSGFNWQQFVLQGSWLVSPQDIGCTSSLSIHALTTWVPCGTTTWWPWLERSPDPLPSGERGPFSPAEWFSRVLVFWRAGLKLECHI